MLDFNETTYLNRFNELCHEAREIFLDGSAMDVNMPMWWAIRMAEMPGTLRRDRQASLHRTELRIIRRIDQSSGLA